MSRSKTNRLLPVALFVLGFALLSAGIASAHADYKSSIPAADSTVVAAPQTVQVTFSEELQPTGNALKVVDGAGTQVDTGDTAIDKRDAERATLLVSLKSGLGNGKYTVNWVNNSIDGHSSNGKFSFTVGAAPAALPTTGAVEAFSPWLLLAGAGLLLAAGLLLRRNATP